MNATEANAKVRDFIAGIARDPEKVFLLFILLAAALKGLLWSALSSDIPDEDNYFKEISSIARTGSSRSYTGHVVGSFARIASVGYRVGQIIGLQPLLAVRLLSSLGMLAVVYLGYRTARLLFPEDRLTPLLLAVLLAFQPMYSFIASSSNSDTLLVLWSSLWLYALALLLVRGPGPLPLVLLSLSGVLGVLTKERFFVVLALLVPAVVFLLLRTGLMKVTQKQAREFLSGPRVRGSLVAGLVALALLRRPLWQAIAPLDVRTGFGTLPSLHRTMGLLQSGQAKTTYKQFWGFFGYLHVPGPPAFYSVQSIIIALAVIGLVVGGARSALSWWREASTSECPLDAGRLLALMLFAVAVAASVYSAVFYHFLSNGGSQGRYLFITLIPIYLLVSRGLSRLSGRDNRLLVLSATTLVMFACNVWALVYLVVPYYY